MKKKLYLCTQNHGGYSSVGLECRIVVPKVVGSNPTSHPKGSFLERVENIKI